MLRIKSSIYLTGQVNLKFKIPMTKTLRDRKNLVPAFFLKITLLDAGSSPAWRSEIKRLFESRHIQFRWNDGSAMFLTFYRVVKFVILNFGHCDLFVICNHYCPVKKLKNHVTF